MKKSENGYIVLMVVFIVGFLIILSSGVFNLVMAEMKDGRGRGNYLQAYYGAESAVEWALLNIKDYGYGYFDEIDLSPSEKSIVLAHSPLSISDFNPNQDVLLSYLIDTKVSAYSGTLASGEHIIFPLYYIDDAGVQHDVSGLNVTTTVGNSVSLVWNIIGNDFGLSGIDNFDNTTLGNYRYTDPSGKLQFSNKTVADFFASSTDNYLLLFNSDPSNPISFSVSAPISDFFSSPTGEILASAKVGEYKQNIRLTLDNTEYTNILKYSIFSN